MRPVRSLVFRSLVVATMALAVVTATAPAGAQGPEFQAPAVPSRSIVFTCPPEAVPPAGFADVADDNVHAASIDCLRFRGLTTGVSDTQYRPEDRVSRDQMASIVARLMEESGQSLPAEAADAFDDDDTSVHEANINALAALGVVSGTGERTFDPGRDVTRGQMATFIVRAVESLLDLELATHGARFDDDDDSVHVESIDKAATAAVVVGVDFGRFDPGRSITRDQLASFAIRGLDLVLTRPGWDEAVRLLDACQVELVAQGHDLSASLELVDGSVHKTTQPYLDAVFEEADQARAAGCPRPNSFVTE